MTTEATTEQTPTPRFEIQRLFVTEQSCKVPHAPAVYQGEWKPDIQLEMQVKHQKLGDTLYEVLLKLSVSAKNEQRTAFVLDVHQGGMFELANVTPEQLDVVLNAHCPTILYPYARKVIADAVYAAGFPTLALAPINFEALYYQQRQTAQTSHKGQTAPMQPVDRAVSPLEEPAATH